MGVRDTMRSMLEGRVTGIPMPVIGTELDCDKSQGRLKAVMKRNHIENDAPLTVTTSTEELSVVVAPRATDSH